MQSESKILRDRVRKILSESYSDAESWRDYYHDNWIQATNTIKDTIQAVNTCEEHELKEAIKKILLQHWKEISPISKFDNYDDAYGKNSNW